MLRKQLNRLAAAIPSSLKRLTRLFTPRTLKKIDLIHELAGIYGYRSLLEISTATTGMAHFLVDRSRFDLCQRVSYRSPDDWSDGAPVEYRSRDLDSSECIRRIHEQNLRFDMVFVDAWHEYETARRDLQDALSLIRQSGLVIAHDCLPENEEAASPYREDRGIWWGVSYKLFVDYLLAHDDLWYLAVDTDWGCGMVRSTPTSALYRRAGDIPAELIRDWRSVGEDYSAAWRLFERHRNTLMNVVSVKEFLAAERQHAEFTPVQAATEVQSTAY